MFDCFFLGIFFIMVGCYFYLYEVMLFFNWDICSFYYDVSFIFYYDWMSVIFLGVMLFISSMILGYSYWYVSFYFVRFINLMVLFILSMFILISSPGLFSMMLGWDGLGVVSFFLINFYYGSKVSLDSSLVTMLFNRFGDSLLLLGLCVCFMDTGICFLGDYWYLFLLIIGFMTKSAQFPFSGWLPKAMAAPTPVSSLVHSSTLVAAGIYMMLRYFHEFYGSCVLMVMGLLTLFMSGIMTFGETDLKKIIAYSTMSQIGFMFSGFYLGSVESIYFHMIVHSLFKSMMFMSSGVVIYLLNCQDLRYLGGLLKMHPYISLIFLCSSFSLVGVPFLSGYFSKESFFYYLFFESSIIWLFLFMFSLLMSFYYCYYLISMLFFNDFSYFSYYYCVELGMGLFMLFLFIFSCFFGMMFLSLVFYFDYYDYCINFFGFLFLFCFFFFGVIFVIFVEGCAVLLVGRWFIDNFYVYIKSYFILDFMFMIEFSGVWLEFGGVGFLKLVDYYYYLFKDYNLFYSISFVFFFVWLGFF